MKFGFEKCAMLIMKSVKKRNNERKSGRQIESLKRRKMTSTWEY